MMTAELRAVLAERRTKAGYEVQVAPRKKKKGVLQKTSAKVKDFFRQRRARGEFRKIQRLKLQGKGSEARELQKARRMRRRAALQQAVRTGERKRQSAKAGRELSKPETKRNIQARAKKAKQSLTLKKVDRIQGKRSSETPKLKSGQRMGRDGKVLKRDPDATKADVSMRARARARAEKKNPFLRRPLIKQQDKTKTDRPAVNRQAKPRRGAEVAVPKTVRPRPSMVARRQALASRAALPTGRIAGRRSVSRASKSFANSKTRIGD